MSDKIDDGPPMVSHKTSQIKRKRRKTLKPNHPWKQTYTPRNFHDLQGADHMIASELPEGFPEELAFRALAAYALLRTLSRELRLSPFTPNVFLRALNLPYPSRLLGQVHVALLRHLLPTLGYTYRSRGMALTKKRKIDGLRWNLRGGDNLTYLDSYTWPLFYDDYVHLTADILYERMHDPTSHLDFRALAMQDENEDYVPSDPEDAEEDDKEDVSSKVARGRGFGLPTRKGRGIVRGGALKLTQASAVVKSKPPPFQPQPKKQKIERSEDSGSDTRKFEKTEGSISDQQKFEKIEDYDSDKRKFEKTEDSDSDASFQSDDSETEDEEFDVRRGRQQPGRRVRPPKKSPAPKSPQRVPQVGALNPNGNGLRPTPSSLLTKAKPGARVNVSTPMVFGTVNYPRQMRPLPLASHNVPTSTPSTATIPIPLASSAPTSQGQASPSTQSLPTKTIEVGKLPMPTASNQLVEPTSQPISAVVTGHKRPREDEAMFNAGAKESPMRVITPGMAAMHVPPMGRPDFHNRGVPHLGTMPRPGMPRPGLPYHSAIPRPGIASIPTVMSMAGRPYMGIPNPCAGRPQMQVPRPWAGGPVVMQMPRPGIPSTLPQMPARPRVQAPPVPKIRLEKLKPKGLCVSDEVADALEKFLSGDATSPQVDNSQTPISETSREKNIVTDPVPSKSEASVHQDPWEEDVNQDEWPQFVPVESMREGTPHHRLPIAQKIQMLEFLIDELLSVDYIAAEFSRRHAITSCYSHRFGLMPTKEELDELENGDECAVCGLEGDLLCCDGCPSSYHKRCIGLNQMARLPEGVWLCPECQIKDPALFGSLKGDRKASVDWFSVKELQEICGNENGLQGPLRSDGDVTTVTSSLNPNLASSLPHPFLATSYSLGSTMPRDFIRPDRVACAGQDDPLMIVHGFVFNKRCTLSERGVCDSFQLVNAVRDESQSCKISTPKEIFSLCQQLGHRVVSRWPLAQLPISPVKIWVGPVPHGPYQAIGKFFVADQSFDPSKYQSIYRLAPLPKALKAGAASKDVSLMMSDYETQCYHVDTRSLTHHLTADASSDRSLSQALRLGTGLFYPHKMICGYLEKLEASLLRAGLLSEFWGLRNKNFRQDTWTRNVQRCRSINRLAKLLVALVDSVHPLAFREDWFQSPNSRSGRVSREDLLGDERRLYHSLPEDWTPAREKAKRKWEQCTDSNVLSLLATNSNNLSEFVDGARLRDRLIGRKRKIVKLFATKRDESKADSKPPEATMKVSKLDCKNIVPQSIVTGMKPEEKISMGTIEESIGAKSDTTPASTEKLPDLKADAASAVDSGLVQSVTEEGDVPEDVDTPRARRSRRQGRHDTSGLDGLRGQLGNGGIDDAINLARRKKIKDLEAILTHPMEKEITWPVCGRYFFDPIGYIAPSEMKRLGRNAGNVVAPYVTYSKTHEVGQGATCHVWRKRCLDCVSYATLVLQIRALQSFLEDDVISTCESAVKRYGGSKATLQKSIACSQRDLSSGESNYFVFHQGRHRGCWLPASRIDTSSYIVEREKRKEKIRLKWHRKALTERKHLEEQTEKKAAIKRKLAAAAAAASAREREASLVIETMRKRELAVVAAAAAMQARQAATSSIAAAAMHARQTATSSIAVQRTPATSYMHPQGLSPSAHVLSAQGQYAPVSAAVQAQNQAIGHGAARKRDIQKYKSNLEATLKQHEVETSRLLIDCLTSGLNSIPEQVMFDLRSRDLAQLREANTQIGRLAGPNLKDERLKALMSDTEELARNKFRANLKAKQHALGNPSGSWTQQHSQPQQPASYEPRVADTYGSRQYNTTQTAPMQQHYEQMSYAHPSARNAVPSPQPQHLSPNLSAHLASSTNAPLYSPNQSSQTTQGSYQSGMAQSTLSNQFYDMSAQQMQNQLYGQHLQQQPMQQHGQFPQSLQQQPTQQYGQFPQSLLLQQQQFQRFSSQGQTSQQQQQQQQQQMQQQQMQQQQMQQQQQRQQQPLSHQQQGAQNPMMEFDFEPRPMEDMEPQNQRDRRQWR